MALAVVDAVADVAVVQKTPLQRKATRPMRLNPLATRQTQTTMPLQTAAVDASETASAELAVTMTSTASPMTTFSFPSRESSTFSTTTRSSVPRATSQAQQTFTLRSARSRSTTFDAVTRSSVQFASHATTTSRTVRSTTPSRRLISSTAQSQTKPQLATSFPTSHRFTQPRASDSKVVSIQSRRAIASS
ncbi:unannotated protein [freshwater metagenome]|uniref:Unannotated protein n=1 Tax=freshwater metagenome TaxID=449393 RepID=A0A6J6FCF5_9ZZZZ